MPVKTDKSDPKKPVTWTFPKSLLADIATVAASENRSVNNFAENVLKNYTKNKLVGVKHHKAG